MGIGFHRPASAAAATAGLFDIKGVVDASANPNYPAASKGDAYRVSVAGKVGGGSGATVEVGDWIVALADNAGGTQASVGSSWGVQQGNLVGAYVAGGTDVPIADGGTGASTAADAFAALKQVASENDTGVVELATVSEINAGSDTARVPNVDNLAGSIFGIKSCSIPVIDYTTNCSTGDGKFYFRIPSALNGMNLVRVHAGAITAGTTNTMDVQIARMRPSSASAYTEVDMLSTKLTVDSGELGSQDAATAAVINASNDDVATNDQLRIDIDAVHTTPAKGLIVTLEFQLP